MDSLANLDIGGAGGLALSILLKVALILGFFLTVPLAAGYVEHKVLAHMQARLGPMEALFHGIGQLPADGIKFLQKEDIIPAGADKWVFALAPGVAIVPTIVILGVVPLGPGVFAEGLDAGLFYALALSSISTIGVLMAAWSSANKYSLMGGIRAAAQLIAYELPLVLAAAAVVVQAGTLNLTAIVLQQAEFTAFGIPVWYGIPHFVALAIFYTSALAELNRPPFDMPIADSEIIFGHMTEYTGLRFAFFLLVEYAGMVTLAAIMVVLFFGGWYPFPGFDFGVFEGLAIGGLEVGTLVAVAVGVGTSLVKIIILTTGMVWLRATFPRLREDQLQRLAWLVLIPLSLFNIIAVAIAKVVG